MIVQTLRNVWHADLAVLVSYFAIPVVKGTNSMHEALPCVHTQGIKQLLCPSIVISMKIARSQACEQIVSMIKQSNASKKQLDFASNCGPRALHFYLSRLSTTPVNAVCMLVPLCMLNIKTGGGHRLVYCTISYTRHEQAILQLQQQCRHGTRGMCSRAVKSRFLNFQTWTKDRASKTKC